MRTVIEQKDWRYRVRQNAQPEKHQLGFASAMLTDGGQHGDCYSICNIKQNQGGMRP